MSRAEGEHYEFWKKVSGVDAQPRMGKVRFFFLLARTLGLTFALRNGPLVAVSGIVTGIAAAFSMAASDYLASRADGDPRAAFLGTVALLVLPYLVLPRGGSWIFVSLGTNLAVAVLIIGAFNFCLSVAKDLDFRQRFLKMAGISLGVSAFSFLVGLAVRALFGIEI